MKIKYLTLALAATTLIGSLASCNPGGEGGETTLATVKIGLHSNLGPGAGYSAINQGFFKEEGIDAQAEIGTGPALASALVNGDINVSFMGGGVAHYYFKSNQPIKLVALDNLTDDDRLIATTTGKGKDLTIDSKITELASALKGSTVALDKTATPMSFWTSLVGTINASLTDGSKIWYEDGDGTKLPSGLADSNYVEGNKVTLANVTNANIATSMQDGTYDFCVAFAPSATTLEKNTSKFKVVAKTSTHMNEAYTPSTWAVNTNWLKDNEETFKKFMRGLVKGMNFRHDTPEETCKDIEVVTKGSVTAASLETDIAVWLNASQQIELYNSGDMVKYATNIYNANVGNTGEKAIDTTMTVDKVNVFSYLIEACNALK